MLRRLLLNADCCSLIAGKFTLSFWWLFDIFSVWKLCILTVGFQAQNQLSQAQDLAQVRTLTIIERFLEDGVDPDQPGFVLKSNPLYPKFLSFFKRVTNSLDQGLYPNNHFIIWKHARSPAPHEEARAAIVGNILENGLLKPSEEVIGATSILQNLPFPVSFLCRLHRIRYGKLGEGCIYGPLRKGLRQGIEITRMKKKDMQPVIIQPSCALRGQAIGFSVRIGMYEEWNNVEAYLSLERPIIGTR
ncbi:hypothetical protein GOBAR_DD23875 [Gossypium barbadense]|nr:hypothetical protein GOBAR_DD23875 [Gossypium barbadense]